jgi:hypothetical protein
VDLEAKLTKAKQNHKPIPTAKIQSALLAHKATWDQWLETRTTTHTKKITEIQSKIEALHHTKAQAQAVMEEDIALHQNKMADFHHMLAQVPIDQSTSNPLCPLKPPDLHELAPLQPLLQDPDSLPRAANALAEQIRHTETLDSTTRQQIAALLAALPACSPFLRSLSPSLASPTAQTHPCITNMQTSNALPMTTTPIAPPLVLLTPAATPPTIAPVIPSQHNIGTPTPPGSQMGDQVAELIQEEERLLTRPGDMRPWDVSARVKFQRCGMSARSCDNLDMDRHSPY